jgi:2-polyprenyl-3-methyl-5-hydroxy-6-metoxy-1,4-benzoquinol methylase
MSLTSPSCPLCGANSTFAFSAYDRNRETTHEHFAYNRCIACDSIFMVDVPTDLSLYYRRDYHGFGDDGEPEWRQNATLLEVDAHRMRMLARHVEPGALIDVGAGAGSFASAAADAGFDVTAIEMDQRCCEYMSSRLGVQAVCSDQPIQALSQLPQARVISLWHSLEHLREPAEMLAVAAERLQPGGVLAIGVPNPRSLQFRALGVRWAHLDAPRHLCLMPESALVASLCAHGLELVDATTGDPFGRVCSLHGWAYALRRRPAEGPTPALVTRAAQALALASAPIENPRRLGPVLTLLFRKSGERDLPVIHAPAGTPPITSEMVRRALDED